MPEQGPGKSRPGALPHHIKVQKADDSSADSGSNKDDGSDKKKAAKGGEKMVRSTSQPLPIPKTKKPVVREAPPEKKWMSQKKAVTPKASPTRPTSNNKLANEKPGKYKSKAYISDSDSSESESVPLSTAVPKAKAAAAAKAVEKSAAPKPTKPAAKETVKPQIMAKLPAKRPREDDDADDDSSSSSAAPLSKRVKPRELKPVPAPLQPLKNRNSDASPNSRGTSSGQSLAKSKNTSRPSRPR